jgi:uncharacterized protein (TIGR02118 family)
MVKISAIYPGSITDHFDWDYYTGKHIPLCLQLIGTHPGFRGVSVERGLSGAAPGVPAAFLGMCHFSFATAEDLSEAFAPHAATLQADVANFTDIQPVLQVSEVVISK